MKRKAFLIVAAALSMLFVGISAHPLLWTIHYWNLSCVFNGRVMDVGRIPNDDKGNGEARVNRMMERRDN